MNKKDYLSAAHELAQYRRLLSSIFAAQGIGHKAKSMDHCDEVQFLVDALVAEAKKFPDPERLLPCP